MMSQSTSHYVSPVNETEMKNYWCFPLIFNELSESAAIGVKQNRSDVIDFKLVYLVCWNFSSVKRCIVFYWPINLAAWMLPLEANFL